MPRSRGGGRGRGHGWSKRSSRSRGRKPNTRGSSKTNNRNQSTVESSHSQANSKDAVEEVGVDLVNGDDEFEAWMDEQVDVEVDPISTNHHFEVEQVYPLGAALSTGKEFEQVYQANELADETIVFITSPAEVAEEEDPLAHNDPLGQSVVGLTVGVAAEEEGELSSVDAELANLRIPSTVEITPVAEDVPTEIIVLPDEPEIVELSSSESNSPGKADVLHVYDDVDNLTMEERNGTRKRKEEPESSKKPSSITYTIAPSLLSVTERRPQLELKGTSSSGRSGAARSKAHKRRTQFTSHETDIEMIDPEEPPRIKDLNDLPSIVTSLPSSNSLPIIVKKNLRRREVRRFGSLNLNAGASESDSYVMNGRFYDDDDNSRDFQPSLSPNDDEEEEEEWKETKGNNKTEKNKKKPAGRKGRKFKRKAEEETEKPRQLIKRRRSGRSGRKSSRAVKQRSSSTETSSEAEGKYCEDDDSPVEKVPRGSRDSDKSDDYDPVGDEGGGNRKTNGIEPSRRTSRYRTRQHRTMLAEAKSKDSMEQSSRKDSVDSGIAKESSGNGCGDDEDEILIVADSVPNTPAVHKGKTPKKKAQRTNNSNNLTNGNHPPDLGPPVLEKAPTSTDDKAKQKEGEKLPKEGGVNNLDNNKGISSAENSFEMLMLPSDEELPDIDEIPMPPPPVFNPIALSSSSQSQITEPSSSLPSSSTSQSQLVQPELNDNNVVPKILTPSDIEMDSESKRVSTPPMDASSSLEAQIVALVPEPTPPEDTLDKVKDSLEKGVTPAGIKKPYYNTEQRNHLYRDGAMLAEREDLSTFGRINLWRMRLKKKLLEKFVPGVIDQKDCHYSVNIFVELPLLDEDFYIKYQPVIFDFLVDNEERAVGKYYNIHGCIPVMGYLGLTDHLYDDFRMFLKFMTLRALTDHKKLTNEMELRENIGVAAVKAVENIENHLASTIEGIMFRNQWPKDVMYCILEYPKMKLTRTGLKKDAMCEPCRRLGKEGKAAYKIILHGPLYDPDTLALLDKRGQSYVDFHYCYVCPQSLRALHRLIHYKYWVFMSIRMELKLFYEKLEPGRRYDMQEIFNRMTRDYDFTKKMFYEFQTTTAEGIFAKDRTDKAEKTAVKKKRDASGVKRPPGRPKSASSINKARQRPKLISKLSKITLLSHLSNSQDLSKFSYTLPSVSPVLGDVSPNVSNFYPAVSNASPTASNLSPAVSNASPTASNLSPTASNASLAVLNVSPTVSETCPTLSNISPLTFPNISRGVSPEMRQCDTSVATPVDMETEPEMPKIDLCSYATPMVTTGPADELSDEPPQVTQVMDVVP